MLPPMDTHYGRALHYDIGPRLAKMHMNHDFYHDAWTVPVAAF